MTSSADRRPGVAAVGVALVLVLGAWATPAATAPQAGFDAAARARIARRWNAAPEALRLEWSEPGPALAAGDTLDSVVGGEGGWFSAIARGPSGRVAWRVRANALAEVAVAARSLAAGGRLGLHDMALESRWIVPEPAADAVPVAAGWEIRRPLAAGEVLAWPAVSPPAVVSPGQAVTASWERGEVRVRLEGRALQGARAGRPLRVRIAGRDHAVTAIAVGPGEVRIPGGVQP